MFISLRMIQPVVPGNGTRVALMLLAEVGDTGYNIILFLHILAMFVAFAAPASNRRLYGSALIVGGLLGFGVAGLSGKDANGDLFISVSDGWVLTSVILWIAMNGVLHAMIIPGERAVSRGDGSKARQVRIGDMGITLLFLVILYLMVFKPGA